MIKKVGRVNPFFIKKIIFIFVVLINFNFVLGVSIDSLDNNNFVHGQTITINGNGFGIKSPVEPLKWDSFEDGIDGQYLKNIDPTWKPYEANGAVYSFDDKHSGDLSVVNVVEDDSLKSKHSNYETNWFEYSPGTDELFVSYWLKVASNNGGWGSCIYKLIRLGSTNDGSNVYHGSGWKLSDSPYLFYDHDGSIGGTSVYLDRLDIPLNSWTHLQFYEKLSSIGATNGELWAESVGHEKHIYKNQMTRSIDFTLNSVFMGLSADSCKQGLDLQLYADDIYIDSTQARIEIGNHENYGACTHREIQIPHTKWSNNQIKFTVNQGSFGQGTKAYLFVIDKYGNVNEKGYPITLSEIENTPVVICNNGQTKSCSTGLSGICSTGTQTCSNNAWGSCSQTKQATTEICGNNLDDDCDGSVDENCNVPIPIEPPSIGVFFSDGFESGDKNSPYSIGGAKWQQANFGGNGDFVSVSTEKKHSGSYSLKFLFGGNTNLADDAWAEQRFNLGQEFDEIFLRYYIYFPENYKIRNDPNGPENNKLFRLWGNDYNNPNKVGMSLATGLSPFFEAKIKGWPMSLACSGSIGKIPAQSSWTLTEDYLGKWTAFEFHVKKDDGTGSGILEMYVNGELKKSQKNLSWQGAPCTPNYFRDGYLMGWANSGFDEDTAVYIDDVVFSTSYIGLIDSTPVVTCTNGQTKSCSTGLKGICSTGIQTCSNNAWGSCTQNKQATIEICGNGIDEDCNGYDLNCDTSSGNLITVDSIYSGYSIDKINDGIIDKTASYAQGSFATAGTNTPHWIEFNLENNTQINKLTIHWAFNGQQSSFMSSQEVQIQNWDGNSFVTIATITNTNSIQNSSINFDTITTKRFRLYQRANKGYINYPTILWVSEIDYDFETTNVQFHKADTDKNGKIDFSEVLTSMGLWTQNQINLNALIEVIKLWKTG